MPRNDLPAFAKRPNGLLASLPVREFKRLQRHFDPVDLPIKRVLYEANRPIEHVYFLHTGVASLVREMQEGDIVEIATIGHEGMVGIALVLGGSQMASRAFMQIAGHGVRMAADVFLKELERSPALHRKLMRYALALLAQVSLSAACNRAHTVEQRCARWLLMTHDRVDSDSFTLTQEFLGQMLGVQRPTVSIAAGMLQKAGLITYSRGTITVLNRKGLEAMSCECYRAIADEYARMLT